VVFTPSRQLYQTILAFISRLPPNFDICEGIIQGAHKAEEEGCAAFGLPKCAHLHSAQIEEMLSDVLSKKSYATSKIAGLVKSYTPASKMPHVGASMNKFCNRHS
jgi:hypothetical protein